MTRHVTCPTGLGPRLGPVSSGYDRHYQRAVYASLKARAIDHGPLAQHFIKVLWVKFLSVKLGLQD